MPAACDYWGLDSLITHTCRAHRHQDGPGWPAWRYMQEHHPEVELFNPDAIHPSLEGSYLAACCLYAALFRPIFPLQQGKEAL